ncbi:MAG: hypothetical protein AAF921_27555 [Cyanobacteria bacterium P01_D01_bin.44]
MTIRIGVYDFFAHLIGGSFLLAFLLYVLQKLLPLPVNIANLSSSQVLILGTIAYVLGYVETPLGSIWYRFWVPKDVYQKTVSKLNQEMAGMGVNLEIMDWYTLVAFIKRHSIDMAQDVEQYNAISIMLRSTSLGFLLFSGVFGIEFLFSSRLLGFIILSFICLFLSIVLIKEVVKYHTYFFRSIYQSLVALILKPEQISEKIQGKSIVSHEPPMHEK